MVMPGVTANMGLFSGTPAPAINGGGMTPKGSQFSDIQKLLIPQNNAQGISPEASNVMNLINQQRDYYAHLGESAAKARATQFGNAGSSIEQFGIAQADQQTNQAALGAQSNVLTSDMANQLAQRQQLAGLTSDEIASLRNMELSQQYMGMQQNLGQQGINLGYQNLNQAAKLGQQQGTNQLIGSLAPLLFGGGGGSFGGFGSGGGNSFISGLFGGSSSAPSLTPGGAGGGFTGLGTNPLSAYGTGAGATSATPGMFSGFGGGAGLGTTVGAGAGGMVLGQQAFGNNRYSNFGGVAGGIGGSIFGPAGTALGSFAGEGLGAQVGKMSPSTRLALQTGGLSLVAGGVGKALGISGGKSNGTGSGDATAQAQQQLDSQTGTLRDLKSQVASGQLSQAEYTAKAQPMINQMMSSIQSMTSKNSAWANAINPKFQALIQGGFAKPDGNGGYVAV